MPRAIHHSLPSYLSYWSYSSYRSSPSEHLPTRKLNFEKRSSALPRRNPVKAGPLRFRVFSVFRGHPPPSPSDPKKRSGRAARNNGNSSNGGPPAQSKASMPRPGTTQFARSPFHRKPNPCPHFLSPALFPPLTHVQPAIPSLIL